jgi:hypothetical protein
MGLAMGRSPVQAVLPTVYDFTISELILNTNKAESIIHESRRSTGNYKNYFINLKVP